MSATEASAPTSPVRVSVCLLVFNHARVLRDAVESVLAQELRSFELILSDDCSTDESWEVIQALAREDPRIRAIQTPRNVGMAANANFAVRHASAPYVALLHHDDICAPALLSRWLDVAERHPSVAFVSNAYGFYQSPQVDYHPFEECTQGQRALERTLFRRWGCPIRGTALIRRSCWDAVGGMRERFGMLADVDLWMRLAARWDVGYVREPLILVRQERPEDYPEAYVRWSWPRFKLLYDIHASNRSEYFEARPVRRELEKQIFRWKVSFDELYWLTYGVVRRRWDILSTSAEVSNPYELLGLRRTRELLAQLARRKLNAGVPRHAARSAMESDDAS
ncbi:MAG: hypothetical protein JWN04_2694 [Myxococcaceae bacterium]|nr:hypothetical protein [Myxococcaceae bacterium]